MSSRCDEATRARRSRSVGSPSCLIRHKPLRVHHVWRDEVQAKAKLPPGPVREEAGQGAKMGAVRRGHRGNG